MSAQVHNMDVRSQPRVIGQVPARVVGILIDDDRIGIPEPIRHIGVVEGRHTEEEVVHTEAFARAAAQMENVAGAETTHEVSMLKWMIKVKALVVRPEIVADPASVLVDMRGFRMPGHIAESMLFLMLFLMLLGGSAHGGRAVWRDELAAVLAVLPSSFLRVERDADGE